MNKPFAVNSDSIFLVQFTRHHLEADNEELGWQRVAKGSASLLSATWMGLLLIALQSFAINNNREACFIPKNYSITDNIFVLNRIRKRAREYKLYCSCISFSSNLKMNFWFCWIECLDKSSWRGSDWWKLCRNSQGSEYELFDWYNFVYTTCSTVV